MRLNRTYAEDSSHSAARAALGLYCSGTVARRAAITPGSTRPTPSSGGDEVLVLLSKCAQLSDAEIFLVEAPASELQSATSCGRVGVLHFDQSIPSALRQRGSLQVDAIDTKAMKLFERRELPGNPFDAVGELRGFFVAFGDRKDIDFA